VKTSAFMRPNPLIGLSASALRSFSARPGVLPVKTNARSPQPVVCAPALAIVPAPKMIRVGLAN
jgi:hypothetical protein